MKASARRSKSASAPLRIFASREEFRRLFSWSIFLHAIPVSLLLMFYPAWMVIGLSVAGAAIYVWTLSTSGKAFDYLTTNYFHCGSIQASVFLYFALGYIGACYRFAVDNRAAFLTLSGAGILSWLVTAATGFSASLRVHERNLKKRFASADWSTGVYDVSSHSLDQVDINSAVVKSFPTWKLFGFCAIILSPGPVIAILAGKISSQAQYMIAIPACWGSSMLFGYFLLRIAVDYWTVRKAEIEHGIRLVISTSPLVDLRESQK